LKFDNSTLNILQFNCSPHPYHLPNFMDVFTWSMPFVIEKVTEMLYYVLQPTAGMANDEELPDLSGPVEHNRSSLSEAQNQAVDIARKLAVTIEKGEQHRKTGGEDEEDARDRMRKKVRSIARMARMFKTLRQENETIIRLKGVCPGHKLAPGLLLAGKDKLSSEVEVFQHIESIDAENEKRPEGQEGEEVVSHTNTLSACDFADNVEDDDKEGEVEGDAAAKPASAAVR